MLDLTYFLLFSRQYPNEFLFGVSNVYLTIKVTVENKEENAFLSAMLAQFPDDVTVNVVEFENVSYVTLINTF